MTLAGSGCLRVLLRSPTAILSLGNWRAARTQCRMHCGAIRFWMMKIQSSSPSDPRGSAKEPPYEATSPRQVVGCAVCAVMGYAHTPWPKRPRRAFFPVNSSALIQNSESIYSGHCKTVDINAIRVFATKENGSTAAPQVRLFGYKSSDKQPRKLFPLLLLYEARPLFRLAKAATGHQ